MVTPRRTAPPPRTEPPTPEPTRHSGPRRTCIGCRSVRSATKLVRVVRTEEGSLLVGRSLSGRGAWLCHGSSECLDTAAQKGGFARAFRAPVDRAAIERLRQQWPVDDDGTN